MDYSQRQESLQSQDESEQLQLYFTCSALQFPQQPLTLQVYCQLTNQPKELKLKTLPQNHANPQFPETLTIKYFFQVRQKLILEMMQGGNVVGTAETFVGEVVAGRAKGVTKDFINYKGTKMGKINLISEKIEKGNNKIVEFSIRTQNLNVGTSWLCFGEKNSFFRLFKQKNNSEYLIYQSESRPGRGSIYRSIELNERKFCNNHPLQPVTVRFYEEGYLEVVIGQAQMTLKELKSNGFDYHMKNGQAFQVLNFKETIKHEFTDYLAAGMQMALTICIDFTGSNGIQTHPTSLHYITPGKRSPYEEALNQVAKIVLDYDTDKLVPTFGFGAKVNMPTLNSGVKVHHCFPINGSIENPNLYELAGIIQGYRDCLKYLSFSGPTHFAPLLREAMHVSKGMKQQTKEYMILLILTDGVIHDLEQVMDLLVKCGRLPLSVIIVGIGNNQDWSLMEKLDDDDCQMTDKEGNKTERDLVQFVVFANHNSNGVELAAEVLEELPRQVAEYHTLTGLNPMSYIKGKTDANHYYEGD